VLMERGNEVGREGGDATAHAERLLVSSASAAYGREFLAGCALYASAEPCAMCAGAVYWSGIGRVVFGQSVESLAITCPDDAWTSPAGRCSPPAFPPWTSPGLCWRTRRRRCRPCALKARSHSPRSARTESRRPWPPPRRRGRR
jgi:hypothetical protein